MTTPLESGAWYSSERIAICHAQAFSDEIDGPVGIWSRDGWYAMCDIPPDLIDPDPTLSGWALCAIVDPQHEEDLR